jgi:hypothetical protein
MHTYTHTRIYVYLSINVMYGLGKGTQLFLKSPRYSDLISEIYKGTGF